MISKLVVLLLFGYATCIPPKYEHDFDKSAMFNPNLFEGDILGIDPKADRNALTYKNMRWPNGIIPYKIMPELASKKGLIETAMKNIEEKTCIHFRPAIASDEYYLKIFAGQGCYTYVGRFLEMQPLSLGKGCYWHSTVVHELMHAVGFFHEHSRSDRDEYIDIHWENIMAGQEPQFRKLDPSKNILYDKFDFDSIMLYGETAFSKNFSLKTMTSKIPGKEIPDDFYKPGLSKSDIYRTNQLYECR